MQCMVLLVSGLTGASRLLVALWCRRDCIAPQGSNARRSAVAYTSFLFFRVTDWCVTAGLPG